MAHKKLCWHKCPSNSSLEYNIHMEEKVNQELQKRFDNLAETWSKETAHHSSIHIRSQHPAYQEIIKMGEPAIPLILRRLQVQPEHWFVALHQITGEDGGAPAETFSEAVKNWLEWGKTKGYLKEE